jgi:hypothetical protein
VRAAGRPAVKLILTGALGYEGARYAPVRAAASTARWVGTASA